MKKLILPLMMLAITVASTQLAQATQVETVPDGGTSFGMLTLGLIALGFLARKK